MRRTGRYLFTSESVTEGHPDKIADQVSDAVLDAVLTDDPTGRVACETLLTTGLIVLAGELTTHRCLGDFAEVAREAVRDVGYTRAKYGFDCETCAVVSSLHGQSPDIAMGVDPGWGRRPRVDVWVRMLGDRGIDAVADHVGASPGTRVVRGAALRPNRVSAT